MNQIKSEPKEIQEVKPTIEGNSVSIKPLKKANRTKKTLFVLGIASAIGIVSVSYARIALKNRATQAIATKEAKTNKIENTSTKKFDKLPEETASSTDVITENAATSVDTSSLNNASNLDSLQKTSTTTADETIKPYGNKFIDSQYRSPMIKVFNRSEQQINQEVTQNISDHQQNQQQANQDKKISNLDDSGMKAKIIKNPQLKVAEGTIFNATLKTRIDSTLKGKVIALLNDDVYSMDGSTLLIERGSELIGDALSDVREGSERLSVIWSSLRTPNNIRIKLDSLGTDTLGGAGFDGHVNHQYGKRFGNAILLSILDDVITATLSKNAHITNNIQNSQQQGRNIAEQMLNNSININPIMYLNQGENVSIIAASDLDFSDVYKFKLKHNE
jgi:type IV secretion system protein VirB10